MIETKRQYRITLRWARSFRRAANSMRRDLETCVLREDRSRSVLLRLELDAQESQAEELEEQVRVWRASHPSWWYRLWGAR